jgi:hypothetical protein
MVVGQEVIPGQLDLLQSLHPTDSNNSNDSNDSKEDL